MGEVGRYAAVIQHEPGGSVWVDAYVIHQSHSMFGRGDGKEVIP